MSLNPSWWPWLSAAVSSPCNASAFCARTMPGEIPSSDLAQNTLALVLEVIQSADVTQFNPSQHMLLARWWLLRQNTDHNIWFSISQWSIPFFSQLDLRFWWDCLSAAVSFPCNASAFCAKIMPDEQLSSDLARSTLALALEVFQNSKFTQFDSNQRILLAQWCVLRQNPYENMWFSTLQWSRHFFSQLDPRLVKPWTVQAANAEGMRCRTPIAVQPTRPLPPDQRVRGSGICITNIAPERWMVALWSPDDESAVSICVNPSPNGLVGLPPPIMEV